MTQKQKVRRRVLVPQRSDFIVQLAYQNVMTYNVLSLNKKHKFVLLKEHFGSSTPNLRSMNKPIDFLP